MGNIMLFSNASVPFLPSPSEKSKGYSEAESVYITPAFWNAFDEAACILEKGTGSVWIASPPFHGCSSFLKRLAGRLSTSDRMSIYIEAKYLKNLPEFMDYFCEMVGNYLHEKRISTELGSDTTEQLGIYLQICMQNGLTVCCLVDHAEELSEEVYDFLKALLEFRSEINGQVVCDTPLVKFAFMGDSRSISHWDSILQTYEENLTCVTLPPLSFDETKAYMRMRLKPYAIQSDRDPFTDDAAEEIFLLSQGLMKRLVILMNYSLLYMRAGKGQSLCLTLLDPIFQSATEANSDLLTVVSEEVLFQYHSKEDNSLVKRFFGLFRRS
jgi:type II secretory pathway predicted ATPase ExeA